ncbi:unnamed protein product [Cylindrotheca closterium]|uniref:SPRY domain-containing protein 7 n=1 Tax=Cylindrotheca closterium TaxID=2856 RepID=A0AAD2CRH9_9STRA|nr:unnamed protein product [Cylindrotheca closterium]
MKVKKLSISKNMTSPNVEIGDKGEISGDGLALAGVQIEQDAAYWEWHIKLPSKTHCDTIMFGVTSKKNRGFYEELEDKILGEEGVSSQHTGTNWMRKVEVENGDVVGVAVQQSDLPMVQFYLNAEPLHDRAVNRFRGTVYPAVCLPKSVSGRLKVHLVLEESNFKQRSPGERFGPVIVARSIV